MKSAIVLLWVTSLLIVATAAIVAAFHPDAVAVTLAIVNFLLLFAVTTVANWVANERGRR